MAEKLTCIALRTIKYDDRHSILTAWSREAGRLSATVPEGASREARRRRALTMPLCIFECEANLRPGREIVTLRELRPARVLPSVAANPGKRLVAMVMAEVLEKLLRQTSADAALADFLFESVARLDAASPTGTANFPITFLSYLAYMLGIGPDAGSYKAGMVFDMADAVFRFSAPLGHRYIEADGARSVQMLARLSWSAADRLHIPTAIRREMLDGLLEFYSMHYAPTGNLRSLDVARSLFS